jgi:magnesium transporter
VLWPWVRSNSEIGCDGEHWFSIGLTIGLTTFVVVLFAAVLGSILPLLLRAARTDPATSSASFVATLADVGGLIIYFSIALMILKGTLL